MPQPLGVADEVGGDRELTIPVAAWYTRIVKWQMDKACVPAQLIKSRGQAPIPDMRRGHERVQYENSRGAPTARRSEKICARDVVHGKFRFDWTGPRDTRAISDSARKIAIAWRCVILVRGQFLALSQIPLHLLAAARMEPMTRLQQIHRCADNRIDRISRKAPDRATSGSFTKEADVRRDFSDTYVVFVER